MFSDRWSRERGLWVRDKTWLKSKEVCVIGADQKESGLSGDCSGKRGVKINIIW